MNTYNYSRHNSYIYKKLYGINLHLKKKKIGFIIYWGKGSLI